MDWYDFVKHMYEGGMNINRYVELKTITPEQYEEITGINYYK